MSGLARLQPSRASSFEGAASATRLPFVAPLAAILSLALAACATVDPPRPPEVRTTTVEVRVPVPVPCFTEAERPVLAPPSPINLETATVDQMAAAMAADDLAEQLFTRAVDALFIRCLKG